MSSVLTVRLLGAPQVSWDGGAPVKLVGGKPRALFIYLVATRRPHTRDTLATLLWSELSDRQAQDNLRHALSVLNRTLGNYVHTSQQMVSFDRTQPYQLDIEQLQDTYHQRDQLDTAAVQAAFNHWRGEFLAGFRVRNAPVFEEWVTGEQEHFHQLITHGLYELATRYGRAQQAPALLATVQQLLTLEPLHEEGYRLKMQALAQSGRPAAALAEYERMRERFLTELGVEPSATTAALAQQIRERMASSVEQLPPALPAPPSLPVPPSIPHNLPGQLTPFLGREQEIAALAQQLVQESYRLITLVGEGGVGKTRLALQVARALLSTDHFAHGVWFVPLAGLTTTADLAERLATVIAQALHLAFTAEALPTRQLSHFLRTKQLLLVLDNFEHLTAGVDFVVELLQQAGQIKVLVTSRQLLHLQAEYPWPVAGLPTPPTQDEAAQPASALLSYDSVALFVERARRANHSFTLTPTTGAAVAQICTFLQGLPLGIELAAAQVAQRSCAEISAALRANVFTLREHFHDLPARHRSMLTVLEDTWQLLSLCEQAALAACAVFQGGFTQEAYTAVAQVSPAILDALTGKSVVHRDGAGRFSVHEFVRQYALTRLNSLPGDQATAAANAHSAYYLALLHEQETVILRHPQTAVTLIQREFDNIQQAWHWALTHHMTSLLAQGCMGLTEFCLYTNLLQDGRQNLAAAIEMTQEVVATAEQGAQAVLTHDLVFLLCAQARILYAQSRFEEGLQTARQAVALAREHALPKLVARGLVSCGACLSMLGDYTGATASLTEAQTLAAAVDTPAITLAVLLAFSGLAQDRHAYREGYRLAQEALAFSHAEGILIAENQILNHLGIYAMSIGDFQQAKEHLLAALALVEARAIEGDKAKVLNNLGIISDQLGDHAAAQQYYQAAHQSACAQGHEKLQAEILGNLGISADYVGDYAAALAYSARCLAITERLGLTARQPIVLINLAYHCHHLGDHQRSEDYSRQALARSQQFDHQRFVSYAWTVLGHTAAARNEFDAAGSAYGAALTLARQLALPYMTVEPLAGLLRVALAQHAALGEVQPLLDEILAYLDTHSVNGLEEPFRVYWSCYQALHTMADPRAQQLLQTAHTLLQRRAAQISDPALRHAFLTQVAANKAIVQEVLLHAR
jgi:predicted ATPase/DNA-binding SARP family transcriptional activator